MAIFKEFPGIYSLNYNSNNQPSHRVEHHVKGGLPVLLNDLLTKMKIFGKFFLTTVQKSSLINVLLETRNVIQIFILHFCQVKVSQVCVIGYAVML